MFPENAGNDAGKNAVNSEKSAVPSINLPKGGGAIRSIGEKFAVKLFTCAGFMTVPFRLWTSNPLFLPRDIRLQLKPLILSITRKCFHFAAAKSDILQLPMLDVHKIR